MTGYGNKPAWWWLAVVLSGLALVSGVSADQGRRTGNYLIIVADVFDGTQPLNDLVAARTAAGFNVNVHSVLAGTSKEAIKTYIDNLWGTPDAPDYILLVGDTDTIPNWTGAGTKHAPTDLYYACMDGPDDWYPDIHLGRFPVRTLEQFQAIVDKTLFVEGGTFPDPDYASRAAFLATTDTDAQAEQTHDWVISNYLDPAGFTSTRIYPPYPDGDDGDEDIAAAVNAGCVFTVYMGHSTSDGWWNPQFDQADVNALTNTGLYGLVFGLSCNTARFTNDECYGETWVRAANKGAAAYVSASDYIYWGTIEAWEPARRMEKYFFQSFFGDNLTEAGPALDAAKYRLLNDPDYGPGHEVTRNFFEEFVLLGDPALQLPLRGFLVNADPELESLCAPPEDTAQFTVEVLSLAGFDETVTLSASGYPGGWDVSFSVNSQPPPFTSVMTVSNLGGSSPGSYTFDIVGTAGGGSQRSTNVTLNLATGAPGQVVLSTPTDGAVDLPRSPTLTWQPVAQAAFYELEVATDPDFNELAYAAESVETEHMVNIYLEPGTQYSWRVRAINGCGEGAYSEPFTFTTHVQPDYFTEYFPGKIFDLQNVTITFTPDGSDDFYSACLFPADHFPTDPAGGTPLSLGEDSSEIVFPSGNVSLYGEAYIYFYVNSNGNITFVTGDTTYEESLEVHFSRPRISFFFNDLSPQLGTVTYKNTAECCAVTFENVPEWNTDLLNNFQVELFYDGTIRMTWLTCESVQAIVGLSEGLGVPADFLPTDFSEIEGCLAIGDMDCNGAVNAFDIDPFILALTSPETYEATYPMCNIWNANINGDEAINAFDIDPFIDLLTGGK